MKLKVNQVQNSTNELPIEINPKQFQKWLDALRSGEFGQAKHTLQNSGGYCCLGVACEVLIPKSKQKVKGSYNKYLSGGMPEEQENAPRWLKVIDNDLARRLKLAGPRTIEDDNNGAFPYLTTLNDTMNFSFEEIADILEAVYVRGELEVEEA